MPNWNFQQNMNKIIAILFLATLFSCGLIVYLGETEKTISECHNQDQYTPVTVDNLREKVFTDTNQYKVVIFFSPACSGCTEGLYGKYKEAFNTAKNTSFYFVLIDTGSLKSKTYFQKTYGIKSNNLYVICDTSKYFKSTNYEKIANISNYFNKRKDITLGGNFIPKTFILNANNIMKINWSEYYHTHTAQSLKSIETYNFDSINFTKIDSLKF